jgi:hypothetical protein
MPKSKPKSKLKKQSPEVELLSYQRTGSVPPPPTRRPPPTPVTEDEAVSPASLEVRASFPVSSPSDASSPFGSGGGPTSRSPLFSPHPGRAQSEQHQSVAKEQAIAKKQRRDVLLESTAGTVKAVSFAISIVSYAMLGLLKSLPASSDKAENFFVLLASFSSVIYSMVKINTSSHHTIGVLAKRNSKLRDSAYKKQVYAKSIKCMLSGNLQTEIALPCHASLSVDTSLHTVASCVSVFINVLDIIKFFGSKPFASLFAALIFCASHICFAHKIQGKISDLNKENEDFFDLGEKIDEVTRSYKR